MAAPCRGAAIIAIRAEATARRATLPDVRTGSQRSLALAAIAAAVIAILFLAFGLVAGSAP